MEILHKITNECIFKSRHKTLLKAVETAVKQGISLMHANLREANLREADLREANLREADLRRAYLRGANLREADLRRANLGEADLKEAKNILCIAPIGSRGDALYAVIHPKTVMIKTGCWWGDIEEFQRAVKVTHKNNKHAHEYFAAITFITQWAELQNKEEDKI